ncbi:dTDP-4-amino-4,6-dideoxygalactose transaminase [Anoxybacillus sp. PDR2]|uniref:dTDP-4-amino-4,6-dideoxygalactose transaminase n=1 Tax=Anoxybacillus sp. PDR2 TaxID=1636720 RepID=UPI001315E46D|nr:dTDP-4-amino-4,6-dideoxygalactose transaminase [Anoxybacillus sp. PDR2]QHC05391.1 dTDP-4-amino-4,6-dideoxygalactose transaminase [Anoxybacillus sp. PDR2]
MIPFNVPPITGNEIYYIEKSLRTQKLSGGGPFTKKCEEWFERNFKCKKTLLVPSCTHALEMAAMLIDVKEGDEIIMPSYTFVSTANAFVIRGAKIVFVDIRPDTMNIDENRIESAITEKTKAIVVVHYAGVACEMDQIMKIASKYNLYVIEDAAQGVMSTYKGRALGTIGHIGCYSFHETKNYTCGEGGAILINDPAMIERAEIIREKGTDRSKFFRGQIDKYTWIDIGSSYLLNDISAAFLYAQLEKAQEINQDRLTTWNLYYANLKGLQEEGCIELPYVPEECKHNGHLFYIKTACLKEQEDLIKYLKDNGIMAVFHYVPLHSSKAGTQYGRFSGIDLYTTSHSERLIRLPLYYQMSPRHVTYICDVIKTFYEKR